MLSTRHACGWCNRLPLKPKRVGSGVVQHVSLPPPRLSEFVISISLQVRALRAL